MKEFGSLAAFAAQLAGLHVAVHRNLENGLKKVAAKVEKTAKAEIGHYQKPVGPFPRWEQLADSTKRDRVRKGFTKNDPLLRMGDLRNSISHKTRGFGAEIGSNLDIAVWQELGTSKIPPRPFLGPAIEHNREAIGNILGGAVVSGFLGESQVSTVLEAQKI